MCVSRRAGCDCCKIDTWRYKLVTKNDTRKKTAEQGYGARWKRARLSFLKINPLCAECGKAGRLTRARLIDHITPHKGDMELFWDTNNWQSLCMSCHSIKTAREDGGFGNTKSSKVSKSCGLDGIPTDSNHHWRG